MADREWSDSALSGLGAWRSDDLRADWVALVRGLHDASRPGGALDSWLFHGTTGVRADSIAVDGLSTTDVDMVDDDGHRWESDGTYWATAALAARYAEDRAESAEDDALPLALVAVPRDALEAEGEMAPDIRSVEWPLVSWTGQDSDAVQAAWEATGRTADDCLALTGAIVCLSPVGPERLVILRTAADLEALLAAAMTARSAPEPR